ncbi:hypothetical protein [Arthrobacter sp. TMS1-12-1]
MDAQQREALLAEARAIPDAGGPLAEYNDALQAWADSHPEVDRGELTLIIIRQLREHR